MKKKTIITDYGVMWVFSFSDPNVAVVSYDASFYNVYINKSYSEANSLKEAIKIISHATAYQPV